MSIPKETNSALVLSGLNLAALWAWGIVLLLAGTVLTMYGADLAHSIAGIEDRLSQIVADFVVTFARLALAPSGALVITAAVLVRTARRPFNA